MRARLTALLLVTLGASTATGQELARLFQRGTQPLRFEAERIEAFNREQRVVARGNVRMYRGGAVLRADEVVIDRRAGRAFARGNVRVQAGPRVLLLGELELDLDSMVATLRDAELYVKEGITPEALRTLTSRRALRRAGRNAVTVRGRRIVKGPGPSYYVEDGSVTPCDCKDAPPSWKITATRITVDPEDGAWLMNPVFRIGEDGVFGLPAVWVPFGTRRTGILQPQVAYTGVNGWLAQGAFFWAATRSVDFTFVGDYLQRRGFRPGMEMRYAAGPESDGRFAGAWIRDSALGRDRFNVEATVRQRLASWARVRLDLALISDSTYVSDFSYGLRERAAEYLTSTLAVEAARGDHAALLAADWFQDLQGGLAPPIDLFSSQAGRTVQRLPRLSYHLLPRALGGTPLLVSARAGFTHFYRTGADFDALTVPGEFAPGDPARTYRRLDFGVGLSLPLDLGGIRVAPRASFRQLVYDAGLPGFPAARGHLLVGLDLSAPLARTFGSTGTGPAPVGAWRHVIEPILSYRYVPATYERGAGIGSVLVPGAAAAGMDVNRPLPGLDDLDGLQRAHRLYAGFRTRLVQKVGPASYRVPLDLRLTQGFDLAAETTADLRLRAALRTRHFVGNLDLSYDPRLGRLDESLLSLLLRDTRGDSLTLAYNFLRPARHERFDLEDVEGPLFRAASARLSFAAEIHEIVVGPTIRLPFPLTLSWTLHYSLTLQDVVQSTYAARYESPCRCWSLSVTVAQLIGVSQPNVGFFLSLTALGSGGKSLF